MPLYAAFIIVLWVVAVNDMKNVKHKLFVLWLYTEMSPKHATKGNIYVA